MKKLICFLALCAALVLPAKAAEAENSFILSAEADGKVIIAPEYVSYSEGQTVGEALANSGHDFYALEEGWIYEIDGIAGEFTRSDETGNYSLDNQASNVKYFRFSEESESAAEAWLQPLMTAMADYLTEEADVRKAAEAEYKLALDSFAGIGEDDARTLATELTAAVKAYKTSLSGTLYTVSFSGAADAEICAVNEYGKVYTAENAAVKIPAGRYTFTARRCSDRCDGTIEVTSAVSVQLSFPTENILKFSEARFSGSYGAPGTGDSQFTDDEFAVRERSARRCTVPVSDIFTGTIYSYLDYTTGALPKLKAIYNETEKTLPLKSYNSGIVGALKSGSEGNTVIYRASLTGADGYTYSQDYTVAYERTPSLTGITLKDPENTDIAATKRFAPEVTEYTYKLLSDVTSVYITAEALSPDYVIYVNGENAAGGVNVAVSGDTTVEVTVEGGEYKNTYTLTLLPGEGQKITFITASANVTLQVVNQNGMVMPYKRYQGTDSLNRYQYTLVTEDTYSYVATRNTYYHVTDDFALSDLTNNTITVDVPTEDYVSDLALSYQNLSSTRGSLALDSAFAASDHRYTVLTSDTENLIYLWANADKDTKLQAIYTQQFNNSLYHGKERAETITSGVSAGQQLKRVLMDENPLENTVTLRASRTNDGITYYQDYVLELKRQLSLKDISAKCDGSTAVLVQADNVTTGFSFDVTEYSITVPMVARDLALTAAPYSGNNCYGEDNVGYRVFVDGGEVSGSAHIALSGGIETQNITVRVENAKAPEGAREYIIHVLKSPPVQTCFVLDPGDALLTLRQDLSGERVWPDSDGSYLLCEGYTYSYTLTRYGYVGRKGTLEVTRNADNALVIRCGGENYAVSENGNGGTASIAWTLTPAPINSTIDTSLPAQWKNFRGNDDHNAVTSAAIPNKAEDGVLYWATKLGSGTDSDAAGSPIVVNGDIITYGGDTLYRIDPASGKILATGKMDHKSSFAITPPTYEEGIIYMALSDGTVQAFNALTLESLWIYHDPLGGQPNCPITVKNGYLYTGFWNSENSNANFVCLTLTDEDPTKPDEEKCASWFYTHKGGFYWAGAYAGDGFVLVGSDDGYSGYTHNTARLLLLDSHSGKLMDSWDGLSGDVRSSIVHAGGAYYFTSKGGSFYSCRLANGKLTDKWEVKLDNLAKGDKGIPMSTSSPSIHNGRAYIGVSGSGQFSDYSGHNIAVIDLGSRSLAYMAETQGYPQTSGLVTTAYADSGYAYIYFLDNSTPGTLRVLRDKPGQYAADYITMEGDRTTAYSLFTPTGAHAQYAICSPIVDAYGTCYFKNDSGYLMAFGSAVEKIEITKKPTKLNYAEGESFDPHGMEVTATLKNGLTRDVTAYMSYSTDPLGAEDETFTLSYPHVLYHNQENGTAMDAGVLSTTPTVTLTLRIGDGIPGDANGDGEVTAADAQHILDSEAQLTAQKPSLAAADVSGDGVIDSSDAVLIRQYLAGKITAFPVEEKEDEA